MKDGRREPAALDVRAAGGSYPVVVGAGLLDALDGELATAVRGRRWRRAFVVTDDNVGPLYLDPVSSALGRMGLLLDGTSIRPGESSKNAAAMLELVDALAVAGLTRSDLVVALGGGVVGDLAGFAAAVFKRGVDLLQLPTTMMAQVDSSIGGKTGVNLPAGKNLMGSFHQPVAVLSDVETLRTLDEREYRSGLAEAAKYSFLSPADFRGGLDEVAVGPGRVEAATLIEAVRACASVKARVVSADEREHGVRVILNYGHTLGHALEAAGGYSGGRTHGEAVAVGMMFAALVSDSLGVSSGLARRHAAALRALRLPTGLERPAPAFDRLRDFILQDKKSAGDVRMVLLEEEGSPVARDAVPLETMAECYDRLAEGD